MYELLLALFLAFSCPAQHTHHKPGQGNTVTTAGENGDNGGDDGDDTGGDGQHVPPGDTPPPPPPMNG